MEIGDKLEFVLVKAENPCSCSGCDIRCGDGIFKLLPKQNRITFKNVSSNILHNDKGEPALLDVVLPITPENMEAVHQAYKKTGQLTVDIYIDKQE